MKRFFSAVVLIAIIVGLYFGLEMFKGQKEEVKKAEVIRPVRTIKIRNGSREGITRYFGHLQGGKRVELSFRVSGPLRTIRVDKGASVKKGTLLATLDPRDYQTNLKQARSNQAQRRAEYVDAQANFKRYENLYKSGAVPKATYDTYKTQMDVAKSALDAAAASTASVQDSLKDTELRAPFDGIIVDRMVENFQDVTAKQAIFSLQDLSTMEIVFNVPDNDILWASSGAGSVPDRLQARFDTIPDRVFPLKVKEIVAQADRNTNTFPITAVITKQDGIVLLPGMSATVEVEMRTSAAGEDTPFLVPETALINDSGQDENFVWRFENNQVRRISVTASAPRNNGYVEIIGSALRDGDDIVVAGAHLLKEGQKVRLLAGK